MDITEGIMAAIFVHADAAKKVSERVPARSKKPSPRTEASSEPLIEKTNMPTSYIRLKPLYWSQAIRSDLDPRYGPGRKLSVVCKPREFLMNNGDNLTNHSLHLAFMEGEPTAADGQPLETGIGQLFYVTHEEVFVHGWYFSTPDILSNIWDQVLVGGYAECAIDLTVRPIKYDGDDPVWDTDRPLFINDATVSFTRRMPAPEEQQQPKRQGFFGSR